METKHTKGEWQLSEWGFNISNPNHDTKQGNIRIIATVYAGVNPTTLEEAKSNAKLIVAAPELLEALIELKEMFLFNQTKQQAKNNHLNETLLKVDNAIKKATE